MFLRSPWESSSRTSAWPGRAGRTPCHRLGQAPRRGVAVPQDAAAYRRGTWTSCS